jgi:ATP-dependent Clp protease protease subunit
MGGAQGQASDIEIAAREIIRMQDKIRQVLAKHTGQTYEKIARDTDRDYYLPADQALEYGLVDEVLLGSQSQNNNNNTEASTTVEEKSTS